MTLKHFANDIYDIKFDLYFNSKLTIIGGDSGTGKTLFFKLMQARAQNSNDIVCININTPLFNLPEFIENNSNKLIVIDNADIILSNRDKFAVATDDKNQYIILGRNVSGFHIMNEQYTEFKIVDNTVKLIYPLLYR